MIGVAARGNLIVKKLGFGVLGLSMTLMSVAGIIVAARHRHAWGMLPLSAALAAGSWRVFRTTFGTTPPARDPWYRSSTDAPAEHADRDSTRLP